MKKLEGVLSNFEGTIVNTRALILLSFRHTFNAHGLEQPKTQDILDVVGLPIGTCFQVLSQRHSFQNTDRLVKTYLRYKRDNPQHAKLHPYAKQTLQWIKDEKIPISLVVSQPRVATMNLLDQLGMADMFHTIMTHDDVTRHKPQPESLNRALANMEIRAGRSIMLGHTPNDILAGRAAGCRQTIAIAHAEVNPALQRARPTTVIYNHSELVPIMKRILK